MKDLQAFAAMTCFSLVLALGIVFAAAIYAKNAQAQQPPIQTSATIKFSCNHDGSIRMENIPLNHQ